MRRRCLIRGGSRDIGRLRRWCGGKSAADGRQAEAHGGGHG